MPMNDLKDLLVHELQDLYSAENQLLEAMPRVAERVTDPKLKKGAIQHGKETEKQVQRLQKALKELGEDTGTEKCKAMEGLVKEANGLLKEKANPEVLDAAIIVAMQKIEHYEIAGYGSAATFAKRLGMQKVYDLVTDTLDEEEKQDKLLSRLAEGGVNQRAVD